MEEGWHVRDAHCMFVDVCLYSVCRVREGNYGFEKGGGWEYKVVAISGTRVPPLG